MTYSQKLKDPRWQKKRLEILNRDAFTCTTCGDKETTLNVHHFCYMGDPWNSESEDLTTWCETCHEIHHKQKVNVIWAKVLTASGCKIYYSFDGTSKFMLIMHKVKTGYEFSAKIMLSDLLTIKGALSMIFTINEHKQPLNP